MIWGTGQWAFPTIHDAAAGSLIPLPPRVPVADYAVFMFFEALRTGKFECYLRPDTRLPMMHITDCLRSLWEYLTVPPEQLRRRVYNVTAMSFTPEELAEELRKYVPHLQVTYKPDSRQLIGKETGKRNGVGYSRHRPR